MKKKHKNEAAEMPPRFCVFSQSTITSVKARAEAKIPPDSSKEVNKMQWNESKAAMENMKYEVAREQGVNLVKGYNGNLSSKDAGRVGGNMVRKMVEEYQRQHSGN